MPVQLLVKYGNIFGYFPAQHHSTSRTFIRSCGRGPLSVFFFFIGFGSLARVTALFLSDLRLVCCFTWRHESEMKFYYGVFVVNSHY